MPDVGECDQASLTALQRSEVRDRQLRDGEKSDRVILGLSNLLVKKKNCFRPLLETSLLISFLS